MHFCIHTVGLKINDIQGRKLTKRSILYILKNSSCKFTKQVLFYTLLRYILCKNLKVYGTQVGKLNKQLFVLTYVSLCDLSVRVYLNESIHYHKLLLFYFIFN